MPRTIGLTLILYDSDRNELFLFPGLSLPKRSSRLLVQGILACLNISCILQNVDIYKCG